MTFEPAMWQSFSQAIQHIEYYTGIFHDRTRVTVTHFIEGARNMGKEIMGCPREVDIFHKTLLGKHFITNLTVSLVSTKINQPA